MPCGSRWQRRGKVPTSAVMARLISWMTKKASFVAKRMSAQVDMSTAPPMQPPWIAMMTGMRASSRQLKVFCRRRASARSDRRARPSSRGALLAEAATPCPSVNTERSMPAEKCLPVDEMTMTRAAASSLMAFTMAGSSFQKARFMVLNTSGRFRRMWAILSLVSTSKQVQAVMAGRPQGGRMADAAFIAWGGGVPNRACFPCWTGGPQAPINPASRAICAAGLGSSVGRAAD